MLVWLRKLIGIPPLISEVPSESSPKEFRNKLNAEALVEEGICLFGESRYVEALNLFESALNLAPESGIAHAHAGATALRLGDLEDAKDHYILANHYAGDNPDVVLGYVKVLGVVGNSPQVISVLENFVASNYFNPDVVYELARNQYASGEHEQAVKLLRQILELEPAYVAGLNLLGLILSREFGDLKEGEAIMRLALKHSPMLLAAQSNLGWILSERGKLREAMSYFDAVLEENSTDDETRLMRAHAYLKFGNFELGWLDFEARHSSPLTKNNRLSATTVPNSLDGKSVLVLGEQGVGDQVMFASCIPDLVESGAKCVLACDSRLVKIFQRSFPNIEVVPQSISDNYSDLKYAIDAQSINIPIGTLPSRFRRKLSDFPERTSFLRADADAVAKWRSRLAALGAGPYIGISWAGGTLSTRRRLQTIALQEFTPLLLMPGTFISLQYGDCSSAVSALRPGMLHHWPEVLSNLDETAALISALDMVVSVCNATVHFGGGLGVPVWALASRTPEWRYLMQGDGIPWYSSVRLFRQREGESWSPLLERICKTYLEEVTQ